jgi:hypothetical protein
VPEYKSTKVFIRLCDHGGDGIPVEGSRSGYGLQQTAIGPTPNDTEEPSARQSGCFGRAEVTRVIVLWLIRSAQHLRVASQGIRGMPQDQALNGRMERRLPIIVVVSLAHLELASTEGVEWTYTDNVSAEGARIFSRHSWEPGDEIGVTPFKEDTTSGSVVYCQRQADDRYFIGVKFKDHVAWSIVRRYNGINKSTPAQSNSS